MIPLSFVFIIVFVPEGVTLGTPPLRLVQGYPVWKVPSNGNEILYMSFTENQRKGEGKGYGEGVVFS